MTKMKLLYTLASLLIVLGIPGSTIAQEEISTRNDFVRNLREVRSISGDLNKLVNQTLGAFAKAIGEIMRSIVEGIKAWFKITCEMNGGPDAYSGLTEGFEIFKGCMKLVINETELSNDAEIARSDTRWDKFAKNYCPKVSYVEKCIRNFSESIKSCAEIEERKSINSFIEIGSSILEFVCQNNADRVATFVAAGGVECLKSNSEAIENCVHQSFGNYISQDFPAKPGSFGIKKFNSANGDFCNDLDRLRVCTVEVLADCEDETPSGLFDSMLNHIDRKIPCKTLLKRFLEFVHHQASLHQDSEKVLKEKCNGNAGPNSYEVLKGRARSLVIECIDQPTKDLLKNNDPKIAFGAFSSKLPDLVNCARYAMSSGRPCLKLEEQESVDIFYNATKSVMEFISHHEEFFTSALEDRETCFFLKKSALKNCSEQIYSSLNNVSGIAMRLEKSLILDIEDCGEVEKFRNCVVGVLEECENQTAAIVVGNMIDSLIEVTPCADLLDGQKSSVNDTEIIEPAAEKRISENKNFTSFLNTEMNSLRLISNCFETAMHAFELENEGIEDSLENDYPGRLFYKNCCKSSVLMKCMKNATDSIQSKKSIAVIYNLTSSWVQDVCHLGENGAAISDDFELSQSMKPGNQVLENN